MPSEIYTLARFHALPGKEEALATAMAEIHAPTSREPGCLFTHHYRSIKDSRLFFIHAQWRNEAAFEVHAQEPHTVRFLDRIESLIDHALEVTRAERIR